MSTRSDHANLRAEIGDIDDAGTEFDVVLADQTATLGSPSIPTPAGPGSDDSAGVKRFRQRARALDRSLCPELSAQSR